MNGEKCSRETITANSLFTMRVGELLFKLMVNADF